MEPPYLIPNTAYFSFQHLQGSRVGNFDVGWYRCETGEILAGLNGNTVQGFFPGRFFECDAEHPLFFENVTLFVDPGQLGGAFVFEG